MMTQMAPFDAQRGHLIWGEPKQLRDVLLLSCRHLGFWNRLDLQQGDHGVFGAALFGACLANFFHDLWKRAGQLELLGPALQLLAKGLAIGITEGERLAALAGVGAAFVTRIGGFELAIGAQEVTLDETKVREQVDHRGDDLVNDVVIDAVAKVTQIIFAWHVLMQAGELAVASALVALVQIATKLGVIDVLIHFGSHFEYDEAGRVVAGRASGPVVGGT
jgi:hypothetical protein